MTLNETETLELFSIAEENHGILMEAIKTAYSTAFSRLLLLVKGGKIGKIISVDATCTSLRKDATDWPGIYEWGPTALLPIFALLGTEFKSETILFQDQKQVDIFAKMEFIFKNAVASASVGDGVKSEGELIISGTKGYRQHEDNVVGVSYGKIGTLMGRIRDIFYRNNVSIAEQARDILCIYGNEINSERGQWLDVVSHYKDGFVNRLRFASSKKMRYINKNMSMKIRLSILMGNR